MNDDYKNELQSIKKLLMLQLLQSNAPVELVAKAVGLNPGSIRNMFPSNVLKRRGKIEEKQILIMMN